MLVSDKKKGKERKTTTTKQKTQNKNKQTKQSKKKKNEKDKTSNLFFKNNIVPFQSFLTLLFLYKFMWK